MLTCLIDTLILALNFRHLPQSAQYYYHNDEDDDPTEDVLSKQGKGIYLPAKNCSGITDVTLRHVMTHDVLIQRTLT